ncbi:MAG: TonB-dependent receptor [Gemmatimonadetes bacterium]|nr:TonB-dependent receptor [Gemmatimonadota bacterium]
MRTLPRTTVLFAAVFGLAFTPPLEAQATESHEARGDTIEVYELDPITVIGRVDDLVSRVSTASVGYVGFADLARRPLTREGELLETIPGMILTQHSGSGKSNQMFVRGFNLDHGTDFATRLEGMPVNIPTHAHGQGYTDLNFIIPEFVDYVEYALGPYYADIGDFGSAGGAHIRLRRSFERPLFIAGFGENGHRRIVAGGDVDVGRSGSLVAGAEVRRYDGPWEVPEDVGKVAGMLRYTHEGQTSRFSLLGMAYDNDWRSTDQIPLRAVESGLIGRYGQIDETLGGTSSRYSLAAIWNRTGQRSSQKIEAYGIRYALDLYSNFTYGLDDPQGGDQFRQEDDGRTTLGLTAAHRQSIDHWGDSQVWTIGAEFRLDDAGVTLSRTAERVPLGIVRSDQVRQASGGLFTELVTNWSDRFSTTLGIRGDLYRFDVDSDLPANTGATDDVLLSPKLSLSYRPSYGTELYLSGGYGFHSNDARGTVTTIDPASGDAVDPVDPLVRSRGAEIGLRASPLGGLRSTVTLWMVDVDSELVFIGDAGGTEASDASRRVGLTLANFWRLDESWSADVDLSVTRARFLDVPADVDRIPGALENVLAAGLSHEPVGDGVFGALRLRRFGSYPLIEDDSRRARANTLANLQVGYRLGEARLTLALFNLFDEEHSDIQYFYASRLPGEPAGGVEDFHFHPAEPRALRVQLSWGF